MSVTRPETRPAVLALALLVPLALYAAFAARMIAARVGYEMDEAIYTESAVFLLRGSGTPPFVHEPAAWITLGGRAFPLMIIPYVGAAKAYFALPLFAIFGVSTEVARFAGVLLGAVGLAGLAALIASRAGLAAALVTALFLAVHPSYLDLTVFDNGGAAVWMGAVGILALALRRHLRVQSARSAFLLGIAAGLAVWARANLMWLLAAAAVAALFVFGRRARPPGRHVRAFTVGGLVGSSPLIWYEFASWFATLRYIASARQPLSGELVARRLRWLAELTISDREQRVVWGGPSVGPLEIAIGSILLALAALAIFVSARPSDVSDSNPGDWRRAFAATAAVLTVFLVTSRLNVSQHHMVAVLPLVGAALAIGSIELAGRVRPLVPVLAAAAAGLAALSISWDVRIVRGLSETGGIRAFSSGIDEIRHHLEAHPVRPDRLKILNWGIQNNLYVASGGAAYGTELFWGATRKRSQRGLTWDDEIRDGGAFLLFAFPFGPPWIGDGAEGFREALARHGGARRETDFAERRGAPYARLIEIEPAAGEASPAPAPLPAPLTPASASP